MLKILLPLLVLSGASCVSDEQARIYHGDAEACLAWVDILGESHQCSQAEGGSLDADLVRRDITQHVITEGYPLPHHEFAQSSIVFRDDGTYEAHKLKYTTATTRWRGESILLVYGEDSRGDYQVNPNGTITLKEPDFSTCSNRKSEGDAQILPHTQVFRKEQPFRTSRPVETGIAFATNGWLGDASGGYWSGTVESRRDFKVPPIAQDGASTLRHRFDGYWGDIHYGCISGDFMKFVSKETIRVEEENRYEAGVNPGKLWKSTSFSRSP